jgi:hypothetical protein
LGALAALVAVALDAGGVAFPLAAGAAVFAAGEAALDTGAAVFFPRGVAFAVPSEQRAAAADARPSSETWSQRYRDDILDSLRWRECLAVWGKRRAGPVPHHERFFS